MEVIKSAIDELELAGISSADLLIILGSGQRNPWDKESEIEVDFRDLPGWSVPGVEGHGGKLSLVRTVSENVLVMAGRHHYYESRSYEAVITPLKVLYALGVRRALFTNSVGTLREELRPGNLVLIRDHILLHGPELQMLLHSTWKRFMIPGYWEEGGVILKETAASSGITLKEGILLCVQGPMYETAAEVEMARRLGADVVAMSLAPEALFAQALGFRVAGLSLVTNTTDGVGHGHLGHHHVVESAAEFQPILSRLLKEAVPSLASS